MHETDDITADALPEAADVGAAEAPAAATGAPATGDAITLAEIEQRLGKKFTSKETALKALSDTFSYVGTQKEKKLEEAKATHAEEIRAQVLAELDREYAFRDNPALAQNRAVVEAFAKANGTTIREAASAPELKALLEKAAAHDAAAEQRSVLESSPRLAPVYDRLQKARESAKNGDRASAAALAVAAVREASGF